MKEKRDIAAVDQREHQAGKNMRVVFDLQLRFIHLFFNSQNKTPGTCFFLRIGMTTSLHAHDGTAPLNEAQSS